MDREAKGFLLFVFCMWVLLGTFMIPLIAKDFYTLYTCGCQVEAK